MAKTNLNIDGSNAIDISMASDTHWTNYTNDTYTINANSSNPWAIGSVTGVSGATYNSNNLADIHPSGKISIKGENADLDINGVSLKDFMQRVEQRLAILTPDARLEAEWEELRVLGDQYRELEKEFNAKMKTFDILKNE
jgi:hypothetical protein